MFSVQKYLFLFPFICFATGYFLSSLLLHQPYVIAPPLVGTSIADACHIASHHGIAIKLLGEKEDAAVPPGTVLRQTPHAGQQIKSYQPLYLLVSKQTAYAQAPALIGTDIRTLTELSSHVPIKIHHINSIQARGLCFAQTPLPNEPITNNQIHVYVSAGNAKPVIWPSFTGQLVQDVLALLEAQSLRADIIHTHMQPHYHRCQDCRVIYQNPRPGCLLNLDSRALPSIQLQVE
jgi:beta-lactam-binding protein with PASTA domain